MGRNTGYQFDPPDENNFGSYIPSVGGGSNKNYTPPPATTNSRRNIQRQPSQELVKSEYPNVGGAAAFGERPSSRRNNMTPTRRPETSMPPTYDYQPENFQRAAKTDQNFFKPNPADDLFDDPDFGARKPERLARNSDQRSSSPTNQRSDAGYGRAYPAAKNPAQDDDFFEDPDQARRKDEEERERVNRLISNSIPVQKYGTGLGVGSKQSLEIGPEFEALSSKLRATEHSLHEAQHELQRHVLRNEALQQKVDANERLLKETRDSAAASAKENNKYHEDILRTVTQNEREKLEALKQQHMYEIEQLKDKYEQRISDYKKQLEYNPKPGLDKLEAKIVQVQKDLRSTRVEEEMGGLQAKLSDMADQMKELRERKGELEEERKRASTKAAEDSRALQTKFKELDDAKAALAKQERQVKAREDELQSGFVDRERSIRDREIAAEAKESRLAQLEQRLRIDKQEVESATHAQGERLDRDKRSIQHRLTQIQEKEYEIEKRLKKAIEREADTRFKEDQVESKLQNLKLREETLEKEKLQALEAYRKAQKEQIEIQTFRDNQDFEKTKITEEKYRLNAFSSKLSQELERLQKDRINVDLMKETLSNLRMDYTKELLSKMDKDNFMRQDVALYRSPEPKDPLVTDMDIPFVPRTGNFIMPASNLGNEGRGVAASSAIPEMRAYKRFDFDDYMTKLKYNY